MFQFYFYTFSHLLCFAETLFVNNIKILIIYYNMELEHCDICGRKCDGVHSSKINKEKEIQKITNMLESYGEKMVDQIIKQIYENRRFREA